jgi:hypothetical protein
VGHDRLGSGAWGVGEAEGLLVRAPHLFDAGPRVRLPLLCLVRLWRRGGAAALAPDSSASRLRGACICMTRPEARDHK